MWRVNMHLHTTAQRGKCLLNSASKAGIVAAASIIPAMKVCVLDQGEFMGGAEGFTLDLLRAVPKSQWDLLLLYHRHADERYKEAAEQISYIETRRVNIPSLDQRQLRSYLQTLRTAWAVVRALKYAKVDVLQTNTIRAHTVGSLAARFLGIPLIWVMHDCTFPPDILKKLLPYPQKIVCVSEFVRDFVVKHGGVEAEIKTEIIPNGIDLDAINADTSTLRPLADIDGKPFSFLPHYRYVGLVGRIDTWKGQDVFLEAIDVLNREYPQHQKVQYLIIGDVTASSQERTMFYEKLRDAARRKGLTNLTFLGRQDMKDVAKRLDILVHASTEPEPFGRTIIEAWAYGVPVIATKLGAPLSFVAYGKTGLLVEPKDPKDLAQKISLLLEDQHLAETLRMNGKKEVRASYDLARIVDRFCRMWGGTQFYGKKRSKAA